MAVRAIGSARFDRDDDGIGNPRFVEHAAVSGAEESLTSSGGFVK